MLPLVAQQNTKTYFYPIQDSNRFAYYSEFLDFEARKGKSCDWYRMNRTTRRADEVSAKLSSMSEKYVTFRYEEQLTSGKHISPKRPFYH